MASPPRRRDSRSRHASASVRSACWRSSPGWIPLGEHVADVQRDDDLVAVTAVGVVASVQGIVVAGNLGDRFSVTGANVPVLAVGPILVAALVATAYSVVVYRRIVVE